MASGDSDGSSEEQRQGEVEEAGEEENQINELVIEDPDALDVDLGSELESMWIFWPFSCLYFLYMLHRYMHK